MVKIDFILISFLALMVSVRSCDSFGQVASASRLIDSSLPFSDSEGTSRNPSEIRLVRLLDVLSALSQREDIAYVWGGRSTSKPETCAACRRCIEVRRVDPPRRIQKCPDCKVCGVDCSGFVSRVLVAAGLGGRRVTSRGLIRSSKSKSSMFAVVGQDLKKARAGDLVVLEDHVVMFLERFGADQLAYVHAAKFVPGRPAGGIEVVVGGPLPGKMQPVVILRHKDLANAGTSYEVRQRLQSVMNAAVNRKLKKPNLATEPDIHLVNGPSLQD